MKNFKLKILSKNKKTVQYFCLHLFKRTNIKQNFKILQTCKNIKKKKKITTLLKSPHIYKTAQEQFEYKLYKQNFNLLVTNHKKFLKLLKKVKQNRFFDLNTQLLLVIKNCNNYFFYKFLHKNLNFFFLNNLFKNSGKNPNFFKEQKCNKNEKTEIEKDNEFFDIFKKLLSIKRAKKINTEIKEIEKEETSKKDINPSIISNVKIKTSGKFLKILDLFGEESLKIV